MYQLTIRPKYYNTATRRKEEVVPLHGHHIHMYTCGPTIYDFAHIGNYRTFVFEDILRRSLQLFGFGVTQVMNLTDVDDKTIRGAIAKGISLGEFTTPYKEAFFADLKTLRVQPAEHYPAATEYIAEMIAMIQVLLDKGFAYRSVDGSVYFSIAKFPHYGCLSHLKLDELEHGASERIASDEYEKEGAADFVLWKGYDEARDGQIFWESPFGRGRPGWHLECSAMATRILGETIDIHVGAVDNIFPHHENEIAQSEACSGKTFARLWMHAEHLIVDGHKMSKSLGNFFTLRDLLARGYSGLQIRYLLLQTHYRTQLNFTFAGLEGAGAALRRLHDFVIRLREISFEGTGDDKVSMLLGRGYQSFAEALADDLNTSVALSVVFDLVREVNGLCDVGAVGKKEAEQVLDWLERCDAVLDVIFAGADAVAVPSEVEEALRLREKARHERQWKEADRLRDIIHSHGFVIEDTPNGARVKKR